MTTSPSVFARWGSPHPRLSLADIWMQHDGNCYEYIVVYVDDLVIASKDPKGITDKLTSTYRFKLKGTGPIDYHLGMSFTRNEHGQLCISPQRYIEKMVDSYK
jgi:hypothetical protein